MIVWSEMSSPILSSTEVRLGYNSTELGYDNNDHVNSSNSNEVDGNSESENSTDDDSESDDEDCPELDIWGHFIVMGAGFIHDEDLHNASACLNHRIHKLSSQLRRCRHIDSENVYAMASNLIAMEQKICTEALKKIAILRKQSFVTHAKHAVVNAFLKKHTATYKR